MPVIIQCWYGGLKTRCALQLRDALGTLQRQKDALAGDRPGPWVDLDGASGPGAQSHLASTGKPTTFPSLTISSHNTHVAGSVFHSWIVDFNRIETIRFSILQSGAEAVTARDTANSEFRAYRIPWMDQLHQIRSLNTLHRWLDVLLKPRLAGPSRRYSRLGYRSQTSIRTHLITRH